MLIAYHMSPQLFSAGKRLAGTGKDKIDVLIEDGLESFRPEEAYSRRSSVFSHPIADFSESGLSIDGYIYEVEIPDDAQKRDLAWIGELQKARLKLKYPKLIHMQNYPDWSENFLKECASRYWAGMASDRPNWEYLSLHINIVKRLSLDVVQAKSTKGGWKP